MPVRRYRDHEAARLDLFVPRGSSEHLPRMRALFLRAARIAPRTPPRGVMKFRSIEEANAEREQRLIEAMRELRARRS